MLDLMDPVAVEAAMQAADELGIKLEFQRGLPLWEAMPSPIHTKTAKLIESSIRPAQDHSGGCGCFTYQDMAVAFPDGSLKRPDIAVFCTDPPSTQEAATIIPVAVIEIISPGSEIKDLELGPPFYLSQGVRDVVAFDPRSGLVLHARRDGTKRLIAPVEIELEAGCVATIQAPA